MYIKQVIVQGFKSYKEQVVTDDLSPKVNCVVGANGSGKSNFFHAIRFVIGDLFHNLHNEDKHAFLHDGGHQVISAFVEIVFHNSDNRIPVDKGEVHLRRTIGTSTDEYFLDGKHIMKAEVLNLLESAGFSRSNPYYVVQQGKIASLTLMNDVERLDLLKEIGGARVYEERRRESMKIMQETGNKRNQIMQVVQYLDERIRELAVEKAELKKYQLLDKQRKSLEYTIYDKELNEGTRKLVEVEQEQNSISKELVRKYSSLVEVEEELKKLDKSFKDLTRQVQGLIQEKQTMEKQGTVAFKKHTEVEHDVKELEENIIGICKAKDEAGKQLEGLHREIEESTAELNKIRHLYDKEVKAEEDIRKKIMEKEMQLSILYQKQGSATQFGSKAARDEWLQKVIDKYSKLLSSMEKQEVQLKNEISKFVRDLATQDEHIKGRYMKISSLEARISGYRESFNRDKSKRNELHDKRKSLWGTENEHIAEIKRLKTEVVKAEKSLAHATPREIRRGLNCIPRICREQNISGVFGPIIKLLECDEKLFTAVEITAGNSLFHVVVENDEISSKVIRHLNAEKAGRVTFIPLNQVKVPHVTYPSSSDVEPLLKKLKYSPNYEQVFARTVICRDENLAAHFAHTNGLDCITREGFQVSKKGGMTGGFYDKRCSKLKLMKTVRQNSMSITAKENELQNVRSELYIIDREINAIVAEQQKDGAKLCHEKSDVEQLKQEVANDKKRTQKISQVLGKKKELLANIKTQIEQVKNNIAMKRDEMGT